MYIETSSPRQANDQAWIQTPLIAQTQTSITLSFWYHMYGSNINRLDVHLVRNGEVVQPALWTKNGKYTKFLPCLCHHLYLNTSLMFHLRNGYILFVFAENC